MLKQPEKGQKLLLLGYAALSKTNLVIPVECVAGSVGLDDETNVQRKKRKVWVMLSDATVIEVMRGDVVPADPNDDTYDDA